MRFAPAETTDQRADGIEVDVVHPLLERDDRVVGDVNVLRANLLAALGDVAVTDSGVSLEQRPSVEDVLRMHLEARDSNPQAGTEVSALHLVVAEHVANRSEER